ncbi:putative LigA [Sphingobium sp. TKS]|nr:putative LigA [Sphingobium sp. TKS]
MSDRRGTGAVDQSRAEQGLRPRLSGCRHSRVSVGPYLYYWRRSSGQRRQSPDDHAHGSRDERCHRRLFHEAQLTIEGGVGSDASGSVHGLESAQSVLPSDTKCEIECYDIGHVYTAAHFLDRGILKGPLLIQSVFGEDYCWSVLGAGAIRCRSSAQDRHHSRRAWPQARDAGRNPQHAGTQGAKCRIVRLEGG